MIGYLEGLSTSSMKHILFFSLVLLALYANAQNDYFLPEGTQVDPSIPTPEEHLGYAIGEFHTRHDAVVDYFKTLASLSNRATFQVIGYTHEKRPQVVLTLTSQANHSKLEQIRKDHLANADPAGSANTGKAIILLGYNVHGNEPSSTEAALLTAYWLTASTDEQVSRYLDQSVIHIDPSFNPDGRDRHTTWVNSNKAFPPVADPLDREHNEAWPGGRGNHYSFDLNRDWLPLTQPESQNRIAFFHGWLPNVVTDFHEMGTNSTYFFEPTEPFGSENPVVPRDNYDNLNNLFAKYFIEAMDEIGSLYFTKEVYDNSYPGYGSTYPDIHGGLGLVFEQASSRGHVQRSSTGDVTFAFTIRNHFRNSIATVKAAVENVSTLKQHQRNFFETAIQEGRKQDIDGWVFGSRETGDRTRAFIDLLLKHNIDIYQTNRDVQLDGKQFSAGHSYVVPTSQKQYRMVRTMFEKVTEFYDSVFYDASAWTVALAYDVPHASGKVANIRGGLVEAVPTLTFDPVAPTPYAWVIDSRNDGVYLAAYQLLRAGVNVKAASAPFSIASQDFAAGSLMISYTDQNIDQRTLSDLMVSLSSSLPVKSVATGLSTSGPDLGSRQFTTLVLPKVLMPVGDGVSSTEAGEKWWITDQQLGMPITRVEISDLNRVNLDDYNVLILVSGSYNAISESKLADIQAWTNQGGTIIAQRSATSWLINKKMVQESFVEAPKSETSDRRPYTSAAEYRGARRIGGSIYMTSLDRTHPLGFGLVHAVLPVYRNHSIFVAPSKSPYNTVTAYTDDPLLSGYVHEDNLKRLKGSASTLVSSAGRGRVVLLVDNPNFRGFWKGTDRLFLNALFYHNMIR